jgi:hypothetical protein
VAGRIWLIEKTNLTGHMWENYPEDVGFEREARNELALDRIQWRDVGNKVINFRVP